MYWYKIFEHSFICYFLFKQYMEIAICLTKKVFSLIEHKWEGPHEIKDYSRKAWNKLNKAILQILASMHVN